MSRPGWRVAMVERRSVSHILVTGGVRSGKSKFAQDLAGKLGERVIYLATAQAFDDEMEERIAKHRMHRPDSWETIEEPIEIIPAILRRKSGDTVLLDCLTLYLTNLFFKYEKLALKEQEGVINAQIGVLAETIKRSEANIVIVTNEIGWGVVPENELARRFRDLAGWANQTIASVCEEVYLLVSGLPVRIKGGNDV